ncbi:MAG: diguanylate cyclase [Ruminococcaceae bacterium]|nr:diguanylate cyclase [Oscillospiraceae bacterium]
MLKEYIILNWSLILILSALSIALNISVFLERRTVKRMYVLVIGVFLLSICVFAEFNIPAVAQNRIVRGILMAIRYSSTPFIIAQLIYTLVKKLSWYVFFPAIVLSIINLSSLFTGIVFKIGEDNSFTRGTLGYLPFIGVAVYCVILIILLVKRSNKKMMEMVPITFLGVALLSEIIFPFVYGSDFSRIFCSTIAVALFIYYVFEILQQTKIDSLTGLLNRQAYGADTNNNPENITSLISIDMNGLKTINDTQGHAAGDEAIETIALCMNRALKSRQFAYRIGGDEFVIICRKTSEEDVLALIKRIERNIGDTGYHCSIGYSFNENENKSIEDMLRESDMMMYEEKERYYESMGAARRK